MLSGPSTCLEASRHLTTDLDKSLSHDVYFASGLERPSLSRQTAAIPLRLTIDPDAFASRYAALELKKRRFPKSPFSSMTAQAAIVSKADWDVPFCAMKRSKNARTTYSVPCGLSHDVDMKSEGSCMDLTCCRQARAILWTAAEGKERDMKRLLANNHSTLAFTNYYGQTPVSVAAEYANHGVMKLLLAQEDSDINSPDLDGQSPLAWAAFSGHSTIVDMLLERDDLNADSKDIDGNTALSWAAAKGHYRAASSLLERYDVQINNVNRRGQTPLSLAAINGHKTIVDLLLMWEEATI